jgi:hypothetical protein
VARGLPQARDQDYGDVRAMKAFLARWSGFGLVAATVVLIASALALTLTRIIPVSPEVDAAPAASTPSASPAASTTAAPLPVGVDQTGGRTFYTVQTFDVGRREGTLAYIAARFDTTVAQLVSWNSIKNPDLIHSGQRLRVS